MARRSNQLTYRMSVATAACLLGLSGCGDPGTSDASSSGGVVQIAAPPPPFAPEGVLISVGTVDAEAGAIVRVSATLHTGGEAVAGVQNDILFDPKVLTIASTASCRINPAISARADGCERDPPSGPCKILASALADCPAVGTCPADADGQRRFRAIVLSPYNLNTLPDDTELYSCEFAVAPDADVSAVLRVANALASSPDGHALPTDGVSGRIVIGSAMTSE